MIYDHYDTLSNFARYIDHKEVPKEEIIEYFTKNYNFEIHSDSEDDLKQEMILLLNNFIFLISEVIDDFGKASKNIEVCEEGLKKAKKESYENRKYKHFSNINKEAIREIDEYLRKKITKHLKEKMSRKTLVFKERNSLELLFDKGKIDFRFLNDYFNPDFDFATYIKFFNIYLSAHEINEIINLKRSDTKKYRELINTVILEKDLIVRIIDIINNHHRLVLRKEIFTTIKELHQSKQYQSFVNLAVIQVEGLFYDLCLELNGGVAEQNIGTLVEKVEKSYKYNKYLYHMITPYYLFEFPEIRNKVAHDGIINDINLKDLSNELILDIFCIVQQINSPSLPINNVKCLLEKIVAKTGIEINKQDNYGTIIYELFGYSGFAINDEYNIYKQIKNRIKYKKVYEFYSIGKTDNFEGIKLNVAVDQLMDVFEDIRFWDIIIEHSNGFNGNEYGFRLLDTLVKEFVSCFQKDHPVKKKCVEAAKFLDQVRNKYIDKRE